MAPFTYLYIDGKERPASSNATFEVRNPYSNEVVGIAAAASSQDCRDAVEAAGKAFLTWENTSLSDKRDIFLRVAELAMLEKYKKKVVEATQEETAATEAVSLFTYLSSGNFLKTVASQVGKLKGETFPSASIPGAQIISQRRAMGVIFAISPWNAPIVLALRAVAIPILCGNTVVLKPSENSPRTIAIAAELFHEAGLPPGVLNFVSMSRETAPALTAEIIAHPLVRKINFTGSDRVGKILAAEAAKYLKPCVFELGGKAPVVVLDDADVNEASKAIANSGMLHSGQICMSAERVIVQRGISDVLISAITDYCAGLKAGDPKTEKLSSLFSDGSAENVLNMVKEAKAGGAELLLGDETRKGSILQPHLLKGVKPEMRLWQRETFGPVILFAVVDSIDEAVELANASEYSLSASLWTTNVHTAMSVAPRIRSGYVNLNGPTVHSEPQMGLIGLGGASGYGRFDIEDFTDHRVIVMHPATPRQYPLLS